MQQVFTERLYLREFHEEDITEAYLAALQDPEILKLTEARHTNWTKEAAIQYVRDSNVPGVMELIGIFLKDTDAHIGNIRLSGFSSIHKRVEFGILIWNRAAWGKGYATEAIVGLDQYIFGELKFHKICADYYAINQASQKMFEKCGYEVEGVLRDHFLLDGQYIDSVRVAKYNPAV